MPVECIVPFHGVFEKSSFWMRFEMVHQPYGQETKAAELVQLQRAQVDPFSARS